jgi:hypothetical protein
MVRQVKEALTPAEEAILWQIRARILDSAQIARALQVMGPCTTDYERLTALARLAIIEQGQTATGAPDVVCGGHVQLQYRPINKGQAYAAMQLCDYFARWGLVPGTRYIKPEDVLRSASRSRELAKLRHWGLVKGETEPGALRKRRVRWTICLDPVNPATVLPPLVRYVRGELKLPHHAVVFHDHFVCFKGPLETVWEVEGFDMDEYQDIIRKNPPPPPEDEDP